MFNLAIWALVLCLKLGLRVKGTACPLLGWGLLLIGVASVTAKTATAKETRAVIFMVLK